MITAELLAGVPLLAEVPASELGVIASRAADLVLRTNDWLIQEGELPSFFIVLSGRLAVLKRVAGADRKITEYGPGSFAGELPLLLGSPAIASLQAIEPSRICRLEEHDFRELIVACPQLNAQVMKVMSARIQNIQRLNVDTPTAIVTIIGHRFDLACHALRDFLSRNHVEFRFRDVHDPATRIGLPPKPSPDEQFPVVEFTDGTRLVTPTFREVAARLGLMTAPKESAYDVAIVGAGPAGLAAAVYGASEGLSTILIEREAPGGQAGTSSRIENYLGFPTGVSGDDLGRRAHRQAERFGAEILVARHVTGVVADPEGAFRAVLLDDGDQVEAKTIVIATGVAWRQLEVAGAEALIGRGIYYGAARTEAPGTRGRDIFLIGGGNSAGQAAMFFAGFARSVTLLVRGDSLARTMSHYLIRQLETQANVHVETHAVVVGLEGDDALTSIEIEDRRTGARRRAAADGVFVFIGADAQTAWLPPRVVRDARGYVCTGRDVMDLVARHDAAWRLRRDPYLLETSVPGVFAAGDVRHGSIKRVAAGVGEGSMAIAFVHPFLGEDATARASPAGSTA